MDVPKDEQTVKAGQAIRSAREANGWSQTELRDRLREAFSRRAPAGEESTIGQPTVSKWESGFNAPEPGKWRVIEEVLGMESGTLARLLLGSDDLPAPAVDQLTARLDKIEASVAEILRAIRAADRKLRDQGT